MCAKSDTKIGAWRKRRSHGGVEKPFVRRLAERAFDDAEKELKRQVFEAAQISVAAFSEAEQR